MLRCYKIFYSSIMYLISLVPKKDYYYGDFQVGEISLHILFKLEFYKELFSLIHSFILSSVDSWFVVFFYGL